MSEAEAPAAPAAEAPPQTEYAALKAAAEAAAEPEAAAEAETPAAPAAKPEPAKEAAPTKGGLEVAADAEPVEDAELPKIDRLLRAREKARAAETQGKQTAERLVEDARRQAREEADRIVKEATARADQMVQERLSRLKSKPMDAIKEIGWDREQLVNEVAREGTAEWQMQKRLEAQLDEARKELADLKDWRVGVGKREQEQEQQRAQAAVRDVEQRFLSQVTLDNAPALRNLYEDHEIVAKGHAAARRLREETGEAPTLDEIREHLEYHAKKRLEKIRGTESPPPSVATKKPANGTRTLNGNSQSERRAAPKSFKEAKTPEEETALLMEAAASAMKESSS